MKLYLAHSFEIRDYVRNEIQPKLENTGLEIVNPFGKSPELYEINGDTELDALEFREEEGWTGEKIVKTDLKKIRECDGLIAYIESPSIGTAMEIFYNSFHLERPTYSIIENEELKCHPWLEHLTQEVELDNLEEIIQKT